MLRKAGAVLAVATLLGASCSPPSGFVARARRGSWHRVAGDLFRAGTTHAVNGLAAPGDGYGGWTAAGSIEDGPTSRTSAAVWSSADGHRWTRADLDPGDGREAVASAAAVRQGRVVVVGTVITDRGDRDGRVWTSPDGSSWRGATLVHPGDQRMRSVAAGPLGLVAAGTDGGLPALWWSADGATWTRVGDDALGPDHAVSAVAVGHAGAVAVGTVTVGGEVDGMAWSSADGRTWRAASLASAGLTGPGAQEVRSVTATSAGFVAVGDDAGGERRAAAVWTSPDGTTWHRPPPSPDMGEYPDAESTEGVSARSVAGSGPVVAVGGGYRLQVWTSADGRRWARESPPVDARGSDDALVVASGPTVLVRPGRSGLWVRHQAGRWTEVGSDPHIFPSASRTYSLAAMVRAGGHFLAFGDDGPDQAWWLSADGRAWQRQQDATGQFLESSVADVVTFGGVTVAAGTARLSSGEAHVAAVWTSVDRGVTWQRLDPGNPAFAVRRTTQIFGVGAAEHGVVAVGLSYEIGKRIDAHAWFSPDGRSWRRASDPPAWGGPGDQLLSDVCALPGGGFLALGAVVVHGDSDVWAWISRDGVTWERAGGQGAAMLGGPGDQFVGDCATRPGRVVVAATVPGAGGKDGVLWETADGATWKVAHRVAGPGSEALTSVVADGKRLVVVSHEDDDTSVHVSSDAGATWRRHTAASFAALGSQLAYEAAIRGDEVVVAGTDDESIAVWIGPAP